MKSEQIKYKVRYGDYIILSEMLDITPDTAKMRIRRNDEVAVEALRIIVKNREELIRNYKNRSNKTKI